MSTKIISDPKLDQLCTTIKQLIHIGDYNTCETMIFDAMRAYPHSATPHNLLGIVCERKGDHSTAMKHFRVAWVLDSTYMPAKQNLDTFGRVFLGEKTPCHISDWEKVAYCDEDCQTELHNKYKLEYDQRGIGHIVRRK